MYYKIKQVFLVKKKSGALKMATLNRGSIKSGSDCNILKPLP